MQAMKSAKQIIQGETILKRSVQLGLLSLRIQNDLFQPTTKLKEIFASIWY